MYLEERIKDKVRGNGSQSVRIADFGVGMEET